MDDADALAFEHAPLGLILSEDRVIMACNAAFTEVFGFAREELVGRSLERLYPTPEEFRRIGEIGLAQMRGTGRYADERIMRRRDGGLFWCRVRGRSLTPEDPFRRAVWSFADLSDTRPLVELTLRERQVAMLMVEGRTAKEIARALGISPRTVEAHRARLMTRLQARNSAEAIARLTGLPM